MKRKAVVRQVTLGALATGLVPLTAAGAGAGPNDGSAAALCQSTFGERGPAEGPVVGEGPSGDSMLVSIGWNPSDWPGGISRIVTCVSVDGRAVPEPGHLHGRPAQHRQPDARPHAAARRARRPGVRAERAGREGRRRRAAPRPRARRASSSGPPTAARSEARPPAQTPPAARPAPVGPPAPSPQGSGGPTPPLPIPPRPRRPGPPRGRPQRDPGLPPPTLATPTRGRGEPSRRRPGRTRPRRPRPPTARQIRSRRTSPVPRPAPRRRSGRRPGAALARTGIDDHIPLAGAGALLAIGGVAIMFGEPRRRRQRPPV